MCVISEIRTPADMPVIYSLRIIFFSESEMIHTIQFLSVIYDFVLYILYSDFFLSFPVYAY